MGTSPRQLWIEALRSGGYKQGYCKLNREDKFCCLGVACELYQKHVGGLSKEFKLGGVVSYDHETAHLPNVVKDWLGLYTVSGVSQNPHITALTDLNDIGRTFEEIADILETHNEYFTTPVVD